MRSAVLLVLAVLTAACTDPVGLSGVWTGVATTTNGNYGFSFTLVETDRGAVSGSGRLVTSFQSYPANVTGAHAHPSLAVTITLPGTQFSPIGYQGAFTSDGNSIRGVLNGSGFVNDSLRLVRSTPATAQILAP